MADFEMRLGWVIVYVDEPAQAAAFYERAFGLRGEFTAPDGSYAQLGRPPNVELALVHEDVDAAFTRALDAGCRGLSEPRDEPRGQRAAYVRDPFGTLVELASPM